MNNKWKWTLGIVLAVILLFIPLFVQAFLPIGAYRMLNYSYGWHMPTMYSGGMMGFGLMFIMWLIMLGLLLLIGLGISWLIRALTAPK